MRLIIETETVGIPVTQGMPLVNNMFKSWHASHVLAPAHISIRNSDADPNIRPLVTLSHISSFNDDDAGTAFAKWAMFWGFAKSFYDVMTTFSVFNLYEEPHNAAFFAHLASNFSTISVLAEGEDLDGFDIVWADLTVANAETFIGGDFLIGIPISPSKVAIVLIQAKIAENGTASVAQFAGQGGPRQVSVMLGHEGALTPEPEGAAHPIFGNWCYYLFWHRQDVNNKLFSPTLRSTRQIYDDVRSDSFRISALNGSMDAHYFFPLFLADGRSGMRVGYEFDIESAESPWGEQPNLPPRLIGLSHPSSGWTIDTWYQFVRSIGYTPSRTQEGMRPLSQTEIRNRIDDANQALATRRSRTSGIII